MKQLILTAAVACLAFSLQANSATKEDIISQQEAIKSALAAVEVEVLGIRHDKPDSQWDVFIKKNDKAYEIEVNAITGEIVAVEEETLTEIRAELSGELSHEGTIGDVDK